MEKLKNELKKFNIDQEDYEWYGNNIVKFNKINLADKNIKSKSKLILMTSINPTAAGEGKTTTAIGLQDGLSNLNKKSILVLREPSLGPVFGRKGTATGGGRSEILPFEKINLHFTGDFHAITTANNLISSAIDNTIYWGNNLNIDIERIIWKRCLDLNDRALRDVEIKITKSISRKEKFTITAASNMMTILTISKDIDDFKKRIESSLIAFDKNGKEIYVKDLKITGSIMAILNDAFYPNAVLTKEGNLCLVHCGPFANIATGTNSIISTNLGKSIADYTIIESGFGSDLGFEKFMNNINYQYDLIPDCVVMVVTIRALKLQNDFENNFNHLEKHLEHIKLYNLNLVVAVNVIKGDDEKDIKKLVGWLKANKYDFEFNNAFILGSKGAEDLAELVLKKCDTPFKFKPLLSLKDSVKEKITKTVNNFYYLKEFDFSEKALNKLNEIKNNSEWSKYPLCMVKSHSSIDGNDNNDNNYKLIVKDIDVNTGAKFILVFTNNVVSLPGLGKHSNMNDIDLKDSKIINLK